MEFEPIYTEKQRQTKISKEKKRLEELLDDIDEKGTLLKLCDEAAFMSVMLEELRLTIQRDGAVDSYQNGANQWGRKKSAAVEVYDKMVNTYSRVIHQITDHLPEPVTEDAADQLRRFNEGK